MKTLAGFNLFISVLRSNCSLLLLTTISYFNVGSCENSLVHQDNIWFSFFSSPDYVGIEITKNRLTTTVRDLSSFIKLELQRSPLRENIPFNLICAFNLPRLSWYSKWYGYLYMTIRLARMIARNAGLKFCSCGAFFMMNSLAIIVTPIETKTTVWVFKPEITTFKGTPENT